ncbi:hypothetical protein ACIBK9_46960 [Nonomuraea sp. NPDC050227]|uniref:hypothetical protein n=1 Tax=Nonomuraea sp. NPDC050227 TaxID=3364360 RepID=UPI0037B7B625
MWPVPLLWWLARVPGWWLARRIGRRLWRHRDLHAVWWACSALYVFAAAAHLLAAPWAAVAMAMAVLAAAARVLVDRTGVLPVQADTVAGALVVLGLWMTAATVWGPTEILNVAWLTLTLAVVAAWWLPRDVRAWRHLRERVRNWAATLPMVFAANGFAGVTVTRPEVTGAGQVAFPLRLPVNVTREDIDKPAARRHIETGMHWPKGSIRDIRQDPKHTSSARAVLIWQEGRIEARTVAFDPPQMPTTAYDAVWLGCTDDGEPFYVWPFVEGYGSIHGLYGGKTGSTKSNLLRLRALLAAYTPKLIWVIDLKSGGKAYAHLLPRIDRIAVTEEQAAEMMADAAAMIPLRAELLLPEHNQVLPATREWPAVEIFADEVRVIWAKTRKAAAAIVEDTNKVTSEGRAFNLAVHGATQYFNQDSVHPKLLPNFTTSFAGRTRNDADSQFLLRGWNRFRTSELPPGAFYVQSSGSDDTTLLFTPEVTDVMLMEAAAATEGIAPTLEPSTADRLPFYRDRWAGLPDTLLQHASDRQREMVREARERAGRKGRRVAAADGRPRLVVSETIEPPGEMDALTAEIADPHLRALVEVHLSPGLVTTAMSNDAVSPRSRAWASARRAAWRRRGLIEQPKQGQWRRSAGERELVVGALEAEEELRSGRAEGGDDPKPAEGGPHAQLRIPPDGPSGRGGEAQVEGGPDPAPPLESHTPGGGDSDG